MVRILRDVMALWLCSLLAGCASLGYLHASVGGHIGVLMAARPVAAVLADPATPLLLRQQLALSQRMRDFAVRELHLPDNASYRRYADLQRPAAVWNVVAAPELSLQLTTSCFPVTGCIGYRGYFERGAAERWAQELRAQGLEVSVYAVPAYSTLGKLPGAFFSDPLLNTFIGYAEADLAGMLFHELAHQVAYAPGNTTFNESFATFVEQQGVQRWMAQHATAQERTQAQHAASRREAFRALTRRARAQLLEVYGSGMSNEEQRASKAQIMAQMRAQYAALKAQEWDGFAGFDTWMAQANNAALGVLSSYDQEVPQFAALFAEQGQDWLRFYAAVKQKAALLAVRH
jgi:predicted aminopeptidase